MERYLTWVPAVMPHALLPPLVRLTPNSHGVRAIAPQAKRQEITNNKTATAVLTRRVPIALIEGRHTPSRTQTVAGAGSNHWESVEARDSRKAARHPGYRVRQIQPGQPRPRHLKAPLALPAFDSHESLPLRERRLDCNAGLHVESVRRLSLNVVRQLGENSAHILSERGRDRLFAGEHCCVPVQLC